MILIHYTTDYYKIYYKNDKCVISYNTYAMITRILNKILIFIKYQINLKYLYV